MMELIDGLPDNVVGIVVTRKVTKKDYDEVLIPALKRSLKRHAKSLRGFDHRFQRARPFHAGDFDPVVSAVGKTQRRCGQVMPISRR